MHPNAFVSKPGAFRIRAADHDAALKSLQRGCAKHMVIADYLKQPEEFASTRYLARAFELLDTQCDVDGGDLVLVPFEGGESLDLSAYYWDFIEAFAHEEKPGTQPEGATLAMMEAGMDVDGEHAASHSASEAADAFIDEMGERQISGEELDSIIASEGSVDFRNYEGRTPLLAACIRYRWAIQQHADALMEGDSDDDLDAQAEAAAEMEDAAHNLLIVLQRKPDMSARTREGIDALGFAAESGSVEFVDQLLAHGAHINEGALRGAVQSLSLDMLRKLAQRHAHLIGADLLVRACSAPSILPGKLEMARYLVESLGCDVNARAAHVVYEGKGRVGRLGTALMAAALADDLAVTNYLLSAGADVHAVDAYGNTALHYCSGQTWVSDGGPLWFALADNLKVIALLRSHGADDSARNVAGITPADLLASRRSTGLGDEAD